MTTSIYGFKIVAHALATQRVYQIQRLPIRKRRRNYRVVAVQQPGCWQVGNTLYMHPELVQKLTTAERNRRAV